MKEKEKGTEKRWGDSNHIHKQIIISIHLDVGNGNVMRFSIHLDVERLVLFYRLCSTRNASVYSFTPGQLQLEFPL